jgi:hypothetical protein
MTEYRLTLDRLEYRSLDQVSDTHGLWEPFRRECAQVAAGRSRSLCRRGSGQKANAKDSQRQA